MTKKYIDADKLIAEIDKKWKELADKNVKVGGGKYDIEIFTYLSVKNLITSLQQEQMEADLEKEYSEFVEQDMVYSKLVNGIVGKAIARHFAEWGAIHLNARKEE